MAKKQATQSSQVPSPPRSGNLNAMLIQGESGLNTTLQNRSYLAARPIENIFKNDAANNGILKKNIDDTNNIIDSKTGEVKEGGGGAKFMDALYGWAKGLKIKNSSIGGAGRDFIDRELTAGVKAAKNFQQELAKFKENIKDGENVNYSQGSSTRSFEENAMVAGENYVQSKYDPESESFKFLVPVPQSDYGQSTPQLDADYEEYRKEMTSLPSGKINSSNDIMMGASATSAKGDDDGVLTKQQWLLQQGITSSGDNETELKAGRAGYRWIDTNELNDEVYLKDADLMTSFQNGIKLINKAGADFMEGGKETMDLDEKGNVRIPGVSLKKLVRNKAALVTMAWDEQFDQDGNSWVEDWKAANPDDDLRWARPEYKKDFDQDRLGREVQNWYQQKLNNTYTNAKDKISGTLNASQKGDAVILNQVEKAFRDYSVASEDPNDTTEGYKLDLAMLRIPNKMRVVEDGDNWIVENYENGNWITGDAYNKEMDPEKLKSIMMQHMGHKNAFSNYKN